MYDIKRPPTQEDSSQAAYTQQTNPSSAALVTDGFLVPELEDLEPSQDAPPAYGEFPDQMNFSQSGYEAGAAVTDAGRVSININTKNRRLADLLAPAIQSQVSQEPSPTLPPAYIPPSLGGQPGQTPPPKLNVVVQIVGSRGDVQPFVALGKVLKDTYGHRVRIATHANFRSFVEDNDLEFFNIGGNPEELMAFMVKHPGLMPGFDAIKSGEVTKRRKGIAEMLLGCWRSCFETGDGFGPPPQPSKEPFDPSGGIPDNDEREPFVADAIIANPPSFAHIHIAEKLGIPLHMMFTMPWTPTRAFAHPLADIQFSNADEVMTKYLSYTFVEMMTWQGLGDVINRFREKVLDLAPLTLIWAPGLLNRLKVPYTYCWSPALIPKPNDWGSYVDVSGFYFLDLATSYTPDPALAAFLESGPPPVYIGFGSIVVDEPNVMTQLIFDAIRYSGVRALVSKGWGGLGADDIGVPEGVFMLGNVPHDWLFQRVSCVVHHGGAGTTAAGIKAGKPTFVVPFFGDQPFWGAMVARAKAGPDPIPYKKLTAEKLSEAINFCLKPETVQQAKIYGEKIREEKGTDVGGQSFHSHLGLDSLRCSVAPSRTAAWRVRRSQVRLSPLAAAALVDEGILQYSDLKLYRPREYNTEDQPPDPISAAACSIVADAGGIGMAIADMPRDMFRSRTKSTTITNPEARSSSPEEGSLTAAGSAPVSAMTSRDDVSQVSQGSPARDIEGTRSTDPNRSRSLTTLSQDSESQRSLPDSMSMVTSAETAQTSSTDRPQPRASRARMKEAFANRDSSPVGYGIDAAMGASRGVGRIVSTGVKSPMNFCLGLAKGFRNVPKLYNDETIRPVEKVTDIPSGIKIASKEFGLGLYDGISGLVTQPIRGASKDGAAGLVKGFGKGIGGIVTKPAAGFWAIPAYTMQGVHAQVNKLFTRSSQNYILASRIIQGQRDLRNSSLEERNDIVARWRSGTFDLKSFDRLKKKDKVAQKAPATSPELEQHSGEQPETPRSAWLNSRLGSKLHSRKNSWLRNSIAGSIASGSGSASGSAASISTRPTTAEDSEYEQAIQASVRETSRGNAEEDAAVEAAIRQSVNAVRQRGELPEPLPRVDEKDPSIFQDSSYEISDEEYQALIEQAIRESMTGYNDHQPLPHESGIMELDAGITMPDANTSTHTDADDSELQRAIEASKNAPPPQHQAQDEQELQRALDASREEAEKEKSQQTEEDIVMEYVKKQSLAEEEFRRKLNKGKGKGHEENEDDDEDLKRAMEESLRMSRPDDSGPSGASGS